MTRVDIEVFKGYAPIEKTATNDGNWIIKGIATTPTKDWEGESVDPNGLDITYLMKQGKINYEHKPGYANVIGEPTANTYVDSEGLHLEAMLYKDLPLAKSAWDLANAMEKSHAKRSLGFSIEGAGRKDPNNPKVFKSVRVTNVAITSNPANPDASWHVFKKSIDVDSDLYKAFMTGTDTNPDTMTQGAAFRKESLPNAVEQLSFALDSDNSKGLLDYVQKELAKSGLDTPSNLATILQLGRGLSRDVAKSFLEKGQV